MKNAAQRDIGVVFLDRDFNVMGINSFANGFLHHKIKVSGLSLFAYHSRQNQKKIRDFLERAKGAGFRSLSLTKKLEGHIFLVNICQMLKLPNFSTQVIPPSFAVTFVEITGASSARSLPVREPSDRIPLELGNGLRYVDRKDVYYCRAEGNYSKLYLPGGSYFVHLPLTTFLTQYADNSFVRVHRGYAVNLRYISAMKRHVSGKYELLLKDQSAGPIPVSRRRASFVKSLLNAKEDR
jgi:DNA-binding LytR/AlgR family response regulator